MSIPIVTGIAPTKGSSDGGDSITITGLGFGDPTVVTAINIGTIALTNFLVTSDTQIMFISPPALVSGTFDVTVTSTEGSSTTGVADEFTYLAKPVVNFVNPSMGTTAGGTSVSISGSGFSNGLTSVNFGVSASPQFQAASDSLLVAISPQVFTAQVVSVTVTTNGGTSIHTSSLDEFTYIAINQ